MVKISKELLIHFQCEKCGKWWSVSEAPIEEKNVWWCPWCGEEQWKKMDEI